LITNGTDFIHKNQNEGKTWRWLACDYLGLFAFRIQRLPTLILPRAKGFKGYRSLIKNHDIKKNNGGPIIPQNRVTSFLKYPFSSLQAETVTQLCTVLVIKVTSRWFISCWIAVRCHIQLLLEFPTRCCIFKSLHWLTYLLSNQPLNKCKHSRKLNVATRL